MRRIPELYKQKEPGPKTEKKKDGQTHNFFIAAVELVFAVLAVVDDAAVVVLVLFGVAHVNVVVVVGFDACEECHNFRLLV